MIYFREKLFSQNSVGLGIVKWLGDTFLLGGFQNLIDRLLGNTAAICNVCLADSQIR